jgi:sec-independent protein translocase protein TatC
MSRAEMSLLGHLEELRQRVIVSALAILAAACLSFVFADPLLDFLLLPSGGLQLRAFGIMDGLLIKVRLALTAGIAFAFPVWALEIMSFVSPALTRAERRRLLALLCAALLLFAGGTAFGYSLLGMMIQVLTGLFPAKIEYLPSASDYISFVLFFLLACGVSFQLPIALILLVQLRVVRAETLRRRRRVAWFILFVFAEIITPVTDPIVAPLTILVPLVILFEGGIFVAGRIEAGREAAPA